MSDYRCDHGGMAMGRDCAQCKALEPIGELKAGSAHRGRDSQEGAVSYRTVIDTTFGKSVIYRVSMGGKLYGPERKCTGEEWLTWTARAKDAK